MLKKFLLILLCGAMLLTGCDDELGEPEISVTDITPRNGYDYAVAEDCGDGCIYKRGGVMWYYDYKRKTSVPFCSDPACKHENKTCAAYLPGRVFGYRDKFVIAGNEWIDSENYIDKNVFILEEFDISSQTKRKVMQLDRRHWCATYAYGDKLFIGLAEEYYLDGDYLFASSDRVRVYFMVVSLDTLEVEYMSECLLDAVNTNIIIFGTDNERLFFDIEYSTERYEDQAPEKRVDFDPERFTKHMVYDIGTKEITENTGHIAENYFDGCTVYFDGKTVMFDCGDKVCELTSVYELPYIPFTPLQFGNGKIYSDVYYVSTQERALLIFDTETEKLSSIKLPWSNSMKFVAEREDEFLFANYGSYDTDGNLIDPTKITALPKDGLSEMTREQYNELCRELYEVCQDTGTAED